MSNMRKSLEQENQGRNNKKQLLIKLRARKAELEKEVKELFSIESK